MAYAVHTPKVLLPPVWPLPLSLAATSGISFDFSSSGYLDVSLPRVPRIRLCVQRMLRDSSSRVFPHSDISGSQLICSSPKLFAACHVLRRLPMPRHSPYALLSLNYSFSFSFELRDRTFRISRLAKLNNFTRFTEKPDFLKFLLLLSCTLIRFSMSIPRIYLYMRAGLLSSAFTVTCDFPFKKELTDPCKYRRSRKDFCLPLGDGLKWTRTTDLALIRRAL